LILGLRRKACQLANPLRLVTEQFRSCCALEHRRRRRRGLR
jgi:hypothetical protein